jgi:hypothetical protein
MSVVSVGVTGFSGFTGLSFSVQPANIRPLVRVAASTQEWIFFIIFVRN